MLERTRIPIQTWIQAALLLCAYPQLAVRQLQVELDMTYKTAWRLRRLIRERLPLDARAVGELTPEATRELVELLFATDAHVDVRDAVGHLVRRGTRARARRSALGSGSAIPREPREARILRATCTILPRRGYSATRMADIAAEAKVSLAALYAHFESREDLLLSAIDWANREGTLEREAIIHSARSATEKLVAFLDLAVPSGSVREEHALYLDLWSRVAGEPKLRPMVVRARERWHRYFKEIIEQGIASGEFQPRGDVDDIVARVVAIQTGLGVEAIVQFDWMPEERARTLLAACVSAELGIEDLGTGAA
jgi:AcrR family transcriptional regulator